MKAYALLGGPTNLWPKNIKQTLKNVQDDLIVGVDRGALFLEEMGILPDLAMGDFDSLQKNDLAWIENSVPDVRYSNPVKDWTDSELMLRTVFQDYHIDHLTIFGATGGRLDHFLINLFMLLNPVVRPYAEKVSLIDMQNVVCFFNAGKHVISKREDYPYIGLASLSTIQDFSIQGARYELKNYSSNYPRVFSSNEFLPGSKAFEISFKDGLVAAIYSKDIDRFHNL
ncbi:thiamine diphosphokinase [Lactobacillus ultunensis]|uniref:Thiamine diphosphokinase n=1 Tax=Lactobacillus ultunensis DSM 16047 TaxID=525365 RepID=C2EME1_9LACO|nr:thiamine diphosphokinase [Lactobacillus ultunensis]EEJ72315.1 thiamine diphosphokinase [Lactobacillus ultunensis DSM 16047]KRL81444.1 thiamine diphosphokinase [Lactobacillus ultunensis DSM 16047]QQP29294.1 thiamine diphosphokinase [Lactobacillus ultunensis]